MNALSDMLIYVAAETEIYSGKEGSSKHDVLDRRILRNRTNMDEEQWAADI